MITIDEQITRDIPFLHIVKAENKDKPLPLVFLFMDLQVHASIIYTSPSIWRKKA